MNGFSLILPTINAYDELLLCLKSLNINSKLNNELVLIIDVDKSNSANKKIIDYCETNKIKFNLNKKHLGPYASWNKGAKIAKNEFLCFITDDQYFAPEWDEEIMKYLGENIIISGQLIESGVLPPSFKTIIKDFGEHANNFREKEFLNFVEKIKNKTLVEGIFFIPLAISRNKFFQLGGFETKGRFGIKSVANDVLFIKKAKEKGMRFKSSLSSLSYHFQASSWEKNKKLRKWKNKIKSFLKKHL